MLSSCRNTNVRKTQNPILVGMNCQDFGVNFQGTPNSVKRMRCESLYIDDGCVIYFVSNEPPNGGA
jgi:hypothetical protein